MSNTEVAIVVLNYQTPDLTFACVRSLEGEIDADCRVVVVDNGSGDDSAELLANAIADWGFAGWAQVVRSPVAAGVAEGARLGIRALPARAYVLIDGKTIVVPGTIRELRKVMRSHPDAGVLGVHVLDGDDAAALTAFRMTGPSGGPSTMARRTAPPSGVVPTLFEQPAEVERVSGECRLLRRELVESVSARNEESRPLFEGGDQGDAARRAGLKVLFVPSARVLRRRDGRQGGTTRVNGGHEPASRHQDADARGPAVSPAVLSSLPPPSPRVAGAADDPHAQPLPGGERNMNPPDISFVDLLREDFRTHDHDVLAPGFWAIALHRFGNLRMDFPKPLRVPATVLYRTATRGLDLMCGIDLSYTVKLGRRVRIWYHGEMRLGARAIGDDVHIRHNTTFGLVSRHEPTKKPIIEDRVDIGTGVCILGDVTVGHDSVIGANSVVVRSFPPRSVLFGVPARPVGAAPASQPQPAAASVG